MEQPFAVAALRVGLALVATFLGPRFKISNALTEILVGVAAGTIAAPFLGCTAVARFVLGWSPASAGWPGSRCRPRRWRSSTP